MNEPTEIVAQATVAGASALFVTLLGVEPQAIVWSLVGSIFGIALARPSGRFYAMVLFVAATLACALLGTVAGDFVKPGSQTVRNVFSVAFGACFHSLLTAFIGAVPGLVSAASDWVKRRIFGGGTAP